jgi:bifunctional ADP-heptose synthase (sugar kinase/adenylyltransferase)
MAYNVYNGLSELFGTKAYVTESTIYSGTKIRFFDAEGKYLFRIDQPATNYTYINISNDVLERSDIFVISDYCKGAITPELLHKIIGTGKPVYIDSKRTDLHLFSASNVVFKINEVEYDKLNHTKKFNSCSMIVTRGKYGSEWLKLNEVGIFNSLYSQGYRVKEADVCGAGDMYLAGLVYGMHYNFKSKERAMAIANAYAAISVSHKGIYVPTYEELTKFLGEHK